METNDFLREVGEVLEHNILDWWLQLRDPRGGFFGEVSSSGEVFPDAPRGVILNARLVWTFASAYRSLGRKEYLDAAQHARDWFLAHFTDPVYGGVYWSVAADGKPLDDKKQLYAQGFAIYGLSELYRACGDPQLLAVAAGLFRTVETHFADPVYGGYIEALSRDYAPLEDMSLSAHDINADKTMNSHLHLLEAYANLYRVWPDAALRKALEDLIDVICRKIVAPDGHLQLYFRKDWSVLPGGISYGHDIETSWLLLEAAFATRDFGTVSRVRPYALALGRAGNEGLLPDGSLLYERLPDGRTDASRQWWVQAESVVGNLWLWKFHGDEAGVGRALAAWAYIREHLVDRAGGDWYWAVLPNGQPDLEHPKAGFWKCPYHNSRMCLQALSIFSC